MISIWFGNFFEPLWDLSCKSLAPSVIFFHYF
jgi:hypothetical protein